MDRAHRMLFAVMLIVGISACTPGAGSPLAVVGGTPLATLESPCADQPAVTGLGIYPIPAVAEPAARQPFRDPVFATCLQRVTDRNADLVEGDDSGGLKNEYSRVQSFNSDGSRLLVRGTSGTWYVYDAASLLPLEQVPLDVDPRWSATDPALIYYSSETRLMSYDLSSGQQAVVHDFTADLPGYNVLMVWTRYEGSPSADGRIWGLMAEDTNWQAAAYLVYDLQADRVTAARDLRDWPAEWREADSVTISPLGTYFLVQMDRFCEPGRLGTDSDPCGLMVYDADLRNGRGLLRIVGHSDTALDAEGREVFVYQDIDTDTISLLDLATGQITPLWPIDFSQHALGLHISGRAFEVPGWALVSTHDGDPNAYIWMDDQVFAIELRPDGRVVHLAHTQSVVDEDMEQDYWAEPQASVNLDFTRVLFTTNWGRSGTDQIETYLIQLPRDWITQLP